MRTNTSYFLFAAILFAMAFQRSALGDLYAIGDPTFGTDAITYDSETGLQWLDVNLSEDRSYTDVAGEFGIGGDYEGFRHCTEVEWLELLKHAGIDNVNSGECDYDAAMKLTSLVGVTDFSRSCLGFFEVPVRLQRLRRVGAIEYYFDKHGSGYGGEGFIASTSLLLDGNTSHWGVGHWLVRQTNKTGDVNGDERVDLLDIGPFVDLLSIGNYQLEADINGDGDVDLHDVQPFVELISN